MKEGAIKKPPLLGQQVGDMYPTGMFSCSKMD